MGELDARPLHRQTPALHPTGGALIIAPMPLPGWLPPLEIFKPVAQAVAVTLGVFLGWRLNNGTQQSDRRRQARAEWAGAAEECLGAVDNHHQAWTRFQAAGPGADPQKLGDLIDRRRLLDDARAKFRAATMRLTLVDARPRVDIVSIELEVIDTERDASHELHRRVQAARGRVRAAVSTWTGLKTPPQ